MEFVKETQETGKVGRNISFPVPTAPALLRMPIAVPMVCTNRQPEVEILLSGNNVDYSKTTAFLDTGSSGCFIQPSSLLLANAEISSYESVITIKYLDGHHRQFENLQFARLWLRPGPGKETIAFRADIIPFEGPDVLLGDDFLLSNKLIIDYNNLTITFGKSHPTMTNANAVPLIANKWGKSVIQSRKTLTTTDTPKNTCFAADKADTELIELKKVVPPRYHEFIEVFRESRSKLLPLSRPGYDLAIELVPGKEVKKTGIYPLS